MDHALRHGDSLVGLSLEQIKSFHWKPEKQLDFVFREIASALDEALEDLTTLSRTCRSTAPSKGC